MLIKNGTLYTLVDDQVIEKGDLRIQNGRIKEIGQNLTAAKGEKVIQLNGEWVLPGMIDAHTHLGMWEEAMGFEGADGNEMTSPETAQVRAIDGCNPQDPAFRKAREAGVTMVMTGPGSANVIGGEYMSMKTYGEVVDEMVLPKHTAMKCAFGENPKKVYGKAGKYPMTRMGIAAVLRESLVKAQNYMAKKEAATKKEEAFEINLAMEALGSVLRRERPLKAHAHRADDILTAMRIAREFNVMMTLDHCTEGHLIVEEIKKSGLSTLIGPTFLPASKIELRNKGFQTVVDLNAAGVRTAVITDHPVISIELLPVCAGYAFKAGMPFFEALKAITIYPAEIMGVEADYGTLEVGKVANLCVYNDNPLSNLSRCLYTFGDGEIVYQAE